MSKQYKHKKTGKIAVAYSEGRAYYIEDGNLCSSYPNWMIEDSCDWEKIMYEEQNKPEEYSAGTIIRDKDGLQLKKTHMGNWVSFLVQRKIDESKIGTEYQLVKEEKKVLEFITEDGIEVFKGDYYYEICGNIRVSEIIKSYGTHITKNPPKRFSSRVKAQEYVNSQKPKPAFISEDGKEMFVGDKYWAVMDFLVERWAYDVLQNTDYSPNPVRKFFSTYKAAEKWIDDNKSIYSKKELRDVLGLEYQFSVGSTVDISYLKDKLKL